ncbi:hypothetical protein [Kitasatospora sp. NPDC058190]|uniref:hypothetical protein n=1 Tax=Kitasatospora sp. NPDC058190 TaxID=3346371 RepID=UPI0036DB2B2D
MTYGTTDRTRGEWSTLQRACVLVALVAALVASVVGGLAVWQWLADDQGLQPAYGWAVGAAVLVGLAAAVPFRRQDVWLEAVLVFVVFMFLPPLVGVGAAASATSDIREWGRTGQAVTATLSGCYVSGSQPVDTDRGTVGSNDLYSCTYRWTAAGQDWEQVRRSPNGNHPDGYHEQVWADGTTGDVAEHHPIRIGLCLLLALVCLLVTVPSWGAHLELLHRDGLIGHRPKAAA